MVGLSFLRKNSKFMELVSFEKENTNAKMPGSSVLQLSK